MNFKFCYYREIARFLTSGGYGDVIGLKPRITDDVIELKPRIPDDVIVLNPGLPGIVFMNAASFIIQS